MRDDARHSISRTLGDALRRLGIQMFSARNENDDYGSIRVRPGGRSRRRRRARRLLRISDHEAPRRGEALRGRGAGEAIEG